MTQPTKAQTGSPMTIRGEDGKPHLVSDLKPDASRPAQRIRPIVPSVFRLPN